MLAAELSQGGWLNFGAFRWSDINIPRALRAGFGMITPLALGLATGHLEYGVYASLGALPAGMVSFQGASRTRVSAVAFAAFGMAVATFVGAVAAHTSGWLLIPAVMIFSYLAGLMAALGQRFLVVGLQWAIQLVIASAIPLPPREAAVRALLVLAGGLWQGALVVVSWALTRGNQERPSLAYAYRALREYAAEVCHRPASSDPVPPPAVFGSDAVADPNPLLRAQERYRFLLMLEQAERIRVSLAAVASYGPGCSVLEPVAAVLDGLADALEARRGHRERADALRERLTAIELPRDVQWRWAAAGLLGEIRGAVRILGRLDQRDTEPTADPIPRPGVRPGPRPGRRLGTWRSNVTAALLALRDNAGTSTEVGRHALRLAVVASIGEVVAQASGLPHGYWIVLTILIVLRPDYASTIYRGVQRAGGTVIGAGLGVATALLLHVDTAALVAAVGVTITIAYAVFAVNYLLFAVFLTDFVVTLMALLGETADQTATFRLAGTGIGAVLALIGYLAWPSWESESAQQKLARLFETQAHYAALVLRAYVRPGQAEGAPPLSELQSAGRAARRARSDAEASADRLADEPARPPMTARLAYALTGIARRLAHTSLTLQAAVEGAQAGAHAEALAGAHAEAQAGAHAEAQAGAHAEAQAGAHAEALAGAHAEAQAGAHAEALAGAHERPGTRAQSGNSGRPGPSGQREISGRPAAAEVCGQAEIVSRPPLTGTIEARGADAVNGSGAGAADAVNGSGAGAAAGAADRFADGVEDAARVIAGSLRSLRPPGDMPPLREWQTAIYDQLTGPAGVQLGADGANAVDGVQSGANGDGGGPAAVLAGPADVLTGATDEFTDALDTAADVLRRRLSG